jgi:hypothetical protein
MITIPSIFLFLSNGFFDPAKDEGVLFRIKTLSLHQPQQARSNRFPAHTMEDASTIP